MTSENQRVSVRRLNSTAAAYRAALARLLRGEGRHPTHAGKVVRITPAAVAREAQRSRNPLYTTHQNILREIADAGELAPAAHDVGKLVLELEAKNRALRADVRRLLREQQELASQNLALLHRAQVAEAKLALRQLEAQKVRKSR